MVTTTNRWRFIETDYARMREHGIFGAGDSVAPVDGELVVQPAGEIARPYRFTAAQYDMNCWGSSASSMKTPAWN